MNWWYWRYARRRLHQAVHNALREWLGVAVNERRIYSHYNALNERITRLEKAQYLAHAKALAKQWGVRVSDIYDEGEHKS